jgi:hypothetical protein
MDRHYSFVNPLLVPRRARVRIGPPDSAIIEKATAPTTAATTAVTRRQSRRGPPTSPQPSQSSSQSQQETNGNIINDIFGVVEFAFIKFVALVLLLAPTRLLRVV